MNKINPCSLLLAAALSIFDEILNPVLLSQQVFSLEVMPHISLIVNLTETTELTLLLVYVLRQRCSLNLGYLFRDRVNSQHFPPAP